MPEMRRTQGVRMVSFLGSVTLLWLLGLTQTLCLGNAEAEAGSAPGAYQEVTQKMKDFTDWLARRGLKLGSDCPVELAISETEEAMDKSRSRPHIILRAARDIAEGETIAHFSRDNLVHSKELPSAKKPKPGKEVEEEEELVAEVHESWAPYARTAAWILREKAKGKSSEWAPYLNILPEHVPSTMFISNEALKLFEDQRLYSYTLAWRNILETEYTVSDPAAIANATLEEFLWAVSMVMSRGYGSHEPSSKEGDLVEVEGSLKGPLVLIPLADLVNHWTWEARTWKRFPPDPKVATAHQEGGGFVFRATASIRKGEEIRACYGHFPNNELALVYGFVLDDNVDDGVTLADGADETVAWFQKILLEENDVLQEKAEYTALDLVNEVEKAVEEEWAALEEHYKKLRIQIRAGEASNSTQEAERAWLFYSRAQFLLGSPQEQRHLTVWSGGGIDPRLLAGLTVLSFFAGEILSNETIDKDAVNMSIIASASINYGWYRSDYSCEAVMIPSGERYAQAMSLAGTLLLGYIKAVLGSSATIEDDRQCLMSVETCSVGDDSGVVDGDEDEEDAQPKCDGETLVRGGVPKYDVIMALKYRMSRKRVLQQAINRLASSCAIPEDMVVAND